MDSVWHVTTLQRYLEEANRISCKYLSFWELRKKVELIRHKKKKKLENELAKISDWLRNYTPVILRQHCMNEKYLLHLPMFCTLAFLKKNKKKNPGICTDCKSDKE